MAKQIWLYSWVDAGMSLSCWMWNRTPVGRIDVATLRTGRLGDNC